MIDIKTLRVGSHILVNGKRERVRGLDEDNGLIIRFPAEYVNANEVEPIPITPDLLKELGFEDYKKTKYREYYTKEIGEVRLVNIHGYQYRDKRITFYRMNYRRQDWGEMWHCSIAEYNASTAGICIVRNLHEAEAFLALHCVELIKERILKR